MATINWPWAVVLWLSDVAAMPQTPQSYADLYTQNGTGGMCDYWRNAAVQGQVLVDGVVRGQTGSALLRPYPNQRQKVVYRRSAPPAS